MSSGPSESSNFLLVRKAYQLCSSRLRHNFLRGFVRAQAVVHHEPRRQRETRPALAAAAVHNHLLTSRVRTMERF